MDKSIHKLSIFPIHFIYDYNFSEACPEVNSHPISIICISIKTEFDVVLLYNFTIIFYDKPFENIQAKHPTEFFFSKYNVLIVPL
jgi:hypothetical protein